MSIKRNVISREDFTLRDKRRIINEITNYFGDVKSAKRRVIKR